MKELPVPNLAKTANSANEIVRAWACDGAPTFVLANNAWSDPAAWGIFAVDLIRHVATAMSTSEQQRTAVMQRIKEGFDAEWMNPTNPTSDSI